MNSTTHTMYSLSQLDPLKPPTQEHIQVPSFSVPPFWHIRLQAVVEERGKKEVVLYLNHLQLNLDSTVVHQAYPLSNLYPTLNTSLLMQLPFWQIEVRPTESTIHYSDTYSHIQPYISSYANFKYITCSCFLYCTWEQYTTEQETCPNSLGSC